jgi:aspartate ammonia-lyase
MKNLEAVREEKDLLGYAMVPKDALYGIQTQRALENFSLGGEPLSNFPELVKALAYVKQACALANEELGLISNEKLQAIVKVTNDIVAGQHHDAFLVEMIQGGAGTSTNMNANEVIANLSLIHMGHVAGQYQHMHPNDDINLSQSTNDAYPSAVRLAILQSHHKMVDALTSLRDALLIKSQEFSGVIKMARTQLQDAVPMTLGQEFKAFASTLTEDIARISELSKLLTEVNLGGTAVGTGLNAHGKFGQLATDHLAQISGYPFVQASDLIEASSDMGAFVLFSSMLKRLAVKLSKISNDLRLLSMGPHAGPNEINLPQRQPGSSIMPGKVNPVIPEAVSQVAYRIIGHDISITMAAEAGQLQLNAMEPLITYCVLDSIEYLTKAMHMLETRCIQGITANEEHCRSMVNNSIGVITAINPYIGYENASRIAKKALATNRNVIELVREEALMTNEQLDEVLKPENMIRSSH